MRLHYAAWKPLVLAGTLLAGSALAGEPQPLDALVSAGYYGRYVWRGQNVNDAGVLQTSVSGGAYGFTGSVWANIDLTGDSQFAPGNAGDFSEIDYALDYSRPVPGVPGVGFSAGVIHYLFPNTPAPSTTEIYGGLSLDIPASPTVTWYRDVNAVDGSYLQIAAGHTFETIAGPDSGCRVGLSLGGSLAVAGPGYNRGYFGVDRTGLNDLTIGIGVPLSLRQWSITPSLNLATMLSGEIGDAGFEGKRTNVWFGLEFSKSF